MRHPRLADLDYRSHSRSPLGESLIQLVTRPEPTTDTEPLANQQTQEFDDWKKHWDDNQKQITQRLSLIESELDRLPTVGNPTLSVF